MANETILQITRTVTVPDSDASFELQSIANGSAQCLTSALNFPLDSGVFLINSSTAISFTVPFNYTLPVTPGKFRLTLMLPATNVPIPGIAAVANNAVNFAICLTGPTGGVLHRVFWEALR